MTSDNRVRVFIDVSDGNLGYLVDMIRFIPEIDRLAPDVRMRYVVAAGANVRSAQELAGRMRAGFGEDIFVRRISKFRPISFDECVGPYPPTYRHLPKAYSMRAAVRRSRSPGGNRRHHEPFIANGTHQNAVSRALQ